MAQGIGFSIPADTVSRVVDQLVSEGRVVRGWLGVGIQSLTKELAEQFGIKEGHGVLVNEVYEHDPAHVAGIKPGDIIVSVDDSSVDSPNQLSRLVARVGPVKTPKSSATGRQRVDLPRADGRKAGEIHIGLPPLTKIRSHLRT